MSTLILPLNFGDRPCDRLFQDLLPSTDGFTDTIMVVSWFSLRIWKDFAIARDDRRHVPRDVSSRRSCPAVRILERYAGWTGDAGELVERGIESGFFTLVPVGEDSAQLVLTDFYPANRVGASDITASKLGGAGKSVKKACERASAGAGEQLEMFRKSSHSLLKGRSEAEVTEGLLFIHQLCNVLRKPVPQAKEWREELLVKALKVKADLDADAITRTFRWLVIHRDKQEIPDRLDFILDQFADFHDRAMRDMS